jgi:hypothetical protein
MAKHEIKIEFTNNLTGVVEEVSLTTEHLELCEETYSTLYEILRSAMYKDYDLNHTFKVD